MDAALKVTLAEISPVWLDENGTLEKVEDSILEPVLHKDGLIIETIDINRVQM